MGSIHDTTHVKYPTEKRQETRRVESGKKNAILVAIAVLLVGGSFIFAEKRNKEAENVYVAPVQVSSDSSPSTVAAGATEDTDGDGVMDWEEILLGTDPKDPKSKEAKPTQGAVTADLTITKKEELTPTDIISRDFFAKYMELRQLGMSNDEASQEQIAARTAGNIVLPQPKQYTLSDVLVKADDSKEAMRQYGNQILTLFINHTIKSRNEAVIAKDAMDKEDPEILKELDPIIQNYKNIINALLKVQAPQSMGIMHLDLINAMNAALFVAESFKKVESDPIAGIQAVNLYLPTEKKLINATSAIKSYFSFLGVTFASSEPGFLFRQ